MLVVGGVGRRVSKIQGSHELPKRPRKHLLHFILTWFLEPACENDPLSVFIRASEPPCGTVHSPPWKGSVTVALAESEWILSRAGSCDPRPPTLTPVMDPDREEGVRGWGEGG